MDKQDKDSKGEQFIKDNAEKCPECRENTLKTLITDWGGLTQYVYKYCLNCGFQEKTIKSLY